MSAHPPSRREVEQVIGPIRHVYGPRWGFRLGVYAAIGPVWFLAFLVFGMFVFCGLQVVGVIPEIKGGPWQMIGPLAFLAFVCGTGFAMLWHRYRRLGSRLLLGEGGMAEWTPYECHVVTAEALGSDWVWHPLGPDNDGVPYAVYLALRHVPTGRRLYVTNFYQGAAGVAQLLRDKLAARARTDRWADLARWQPPPEPTGDEATRVAAAQARTDPTRETP